MLRKFSYVAFVILLIASPMLVETAPAERTQVGVASHIAPMIPNFNQANRHPIATSHRKSTSISPLAAAAPVFLPPVAYDAGGSPWGNLAIADFNADGNLDMVLPNQGFYGFTVGILLGNGHGWFAPPVSYAPGPPWAATWPQSVAVADVNGDDRPDLIVGVACDGPTCTESVVGVLLGNGDGSFQPGVTYSTGAWFAYAVAVADVDADGKPDVLVGNQCTTNQWICEHGTVVSVLLGNGDGTFRPPSSYRCGGSAGFYNSLAVADVNSDGKSDVVVATGQSNGYGTVAVLLGNGDGTFQAEIDYASGSQGSWSSSLAVGDINKDGKPDIAVMNYEGTVGVLLGNGDGTFQPPVNYDANGDLALVVIAL